MPDPFNPRFRINSDIAAAVAISIAPIIYFLPALCAGRVLCPADGIIQNVPFRVAVAQILRSGDLPLWNPYIFSGLPLLAAAQAGILFPLNWFYLLFGPATATNLMVVSSYVVAALGAFLYARRVSASISGAMVTAVVWSFGGAVIGQLTHINIVHTSALLPWVLWSLEAYAQTGNQRRGVLLAALLAMQFFAGHQQTFVYSLLLVIAYALVMAAANVELRKRYFASMAYLAAGIPLAALQILPTWELLRNSERAAATYDFFTSFSMPPRFVLALLAPYVMGGGDGRLFRAPYVGPPYYTEMVGYVGVLAVMLAIISLLINRDTRTKFWLIVFVVSLFLALGGYAPVHFYELIYHVPVLNLFRVPARHLMEVDFALAVLAGRGLTVLGAARKRNSGRFTVVLAGLSVFLATLATVTILRSSNFQLARDIPLTILRAPELFLPILIAAASAAALWMFARGRRASLLLLFTVLLVDLAVWGQSSGWLTTSPLGNAEYWRVPQVVQVLRGFAPADNSSYRILTLPHAFNPAQPVVPPPTISSVLWTQPDVYMPHGIYNAAGYDGFGLDRYQTLAGQMKVWGQLSYPDASLRGDSREIDLLNVRYVIAARGDGQRIQPRSAADSFASTSAKIGELTFAATDFGLPVFGKAKRLRFDIASVEIDRVALVTSLAWSEDVPDNTVVARLRLKSAAGREVELPLRAGADTAEWAYDRRDIRARIRHRRPPIATSYEVNDGGEKYEAHTFLTTLFLAERLNVVSGELTLEPNNRWPDLSIGVSRISLMDSAAGITYPLRREAVTVAPASTRSDDGLAERWKRVGETDEVEVYENRRALPRAWLASDVRVLNEAAILEVIRTGKFSDGSIWDPARTALVESAVREKVGPSSQTEVLITKYAPNGIVLNARADAPSILVLSENHYSGWRAYVDGNLVETMRVNYNLRGVALPAGQHEVKFVYWPKSVMIGLAISLLTLTGLVLWPVISRKSIRLFGSFKAASR